MTCFPYVSVAPGKRGLYKITLRFVQFITLIAMVPLYETSVLRGDQTAFSGWFRQAMAVGLTFFFEYFFYALAITLLMSTGIFDQNGTEKKVLSAQVEVEAPGKAVSFMGYLQGEQKYNFEFNPKENFSSFRHLLEKLKSNLERKIVLSLFCAPMG